MPIQLNYTDPDNSIVFTASYWFMTSYNGDEVANVINAVISGYKDLTAKNAGKQPYKLKNYAISYGQLGISASSTITQLRAAIYNFILANDSFFTGGTIV